MNVHGLSGIATRPLVGPLAEKPAGPAGAGAPTAEFGKALEKAVDAIDGDQQASAAALRDLLTGKNQDVLPVVTAAAKASASFKLLLGVRNKMIEAYKQTINMPV